jgi:putative glutamine amidotransferase
MSLAARPLIGLPGRRKRGADIAGFPEVLRDVELDLYFVDYARGVLEAGGLPVHLPLDADPLAYLDRLDGIVLPGGTDVDPVLYGEYATTDFYPPEPIRDQFEMALAAGGLAGDVPMLGICRGLQLFNVQAGGSLHQDVPEHSRFDAPVGTLAHRVTIEPGTQLASLFGEGAEVNSLHHQTVDRVAPGWVVAARDEQGSIEAIELPGHDVIAVQWHPEMLPGRASDPLFAWIVERAAARSEARSDRKEGSWAGG